MGIRRAILLLFCLGILTWTACDDANEPEDVSEENTTEPAMIPEQEEFHRQAMSSLDELAAAVDSLETKEPISDTVRAALGERIHHLREEITEVEEMTAAVYRDRYDTLQERLYELEGEVVTARLAASSNRQTFLQAARHQMVKLERDLSGLAKRIEAEKEQSPTPHIPDLGGIRTQREEIVTTLERLKEEEMQLSRETQMNLAEEIGELTADLRRIQSLFQFPQIEA